MPPPNPPSLLQQGRDGAVLFQSLQDPRPATVPSRPTTALSTVLEGGRGLFVSQANSTQVLRDVHQEEELRGGHPDDERAASRSPTLAKLPSSLSPAPLGQFSKFWGGAPSPLREGASPRRAAAGAVWRERRDQRAESEIIARQRTYETRRGRGRGR